MLDFNNFHLVEKIAINTSQYVIKKNDKTNINQKKKIDNQPIIISIDAGHGGRDPGAIGQNKSQEKKITFNIAKKLKSLLDKNDKFKTFLIRKEDCFMSIKDRLNLINKNKTNILISIHVNSSINKQAKGASILVLSNDRAKNEILNLLKRKYTNDNMNCPLHKIKKNSKNIKNINSSSLNEKLLKSQFIKSKKIGIEIAIKILQELKTITTLYRNKPIHASLGILCSINVPSILIEIGFISNLNEEKLLQSDYFQEKIAKALYYGLNSYFININKKQFF